MEDGRLDTMLLNGRSFKNMSNRELIDIKNDDNTAIGFLPAIIDELNSRLEYNQGWHLTGR